jgi:hypothetical protein
LKIRRHFHLLPSFPSIRRWQCYWRDGGWNANPNANSDALDAFPEIIRQRSSIFYWPLDQRERNGRGKPGKLHAKAAVIDNQAIGHEIGHRAADCTEVEDAA